MISGSNMAATLLQNTGDWIEFLLLELEASHFSMGDVTLTESISHMQ